MAELAKPSAITKALVTNLAAERLHPWLLIRKFPRLARVWSHFLKSPGSYSRV